MNYISLVLSNLACLIKPLGTYLLVEMETAPLIKNLNGIDVCSSDLEIKFL